MTHFWTGAFSPGFCAWFFSWAPLNKTVNCSGGDPFLFFFNHPTSSDTAGNSRPASSTLTLLMRSAPLSWVWVALRWCRLADAGACPRVSLSVGLSVVRLAWLYQACWSSLECDWRWMTFPRTPPACWHLFLTLRMRAGGGRGLFESAGSMGLPLVLQNGSSNS